MSLCNQIIDDVVGRMTWSELTLLGCEIHKRKKEKCEEKFIIWEKKLYEMTPSINWDGQNINRFEMNCGSSELLHGNMNHSVYVEINNKGKIVDGVEMYGLCREGCFRKLQFRVEIDFKGEIMSWCSNIQKDLTQNIDEQSIIDEIKQYIEYLKIEFFKFCWFKNDPTNEKEYGRLKDENLRPIGRFGSFGFW